MSNTNSKLRVHVLAAATAVALAALAAPAFAGQAYVADLKADGQYGRFMIKYKNSSAPTTSTAALASSLNTAASRTLMPAGSKGKRVGLKHLRRMALGADVITSDTTLNGDEAAALIRQLAADPNVEWVQSDFVVHALAVPNDPLYSSQWHYADDAVGIRAPVAWNTSTGTGVVVAVIDSGILPHSDLDANILPGYDMISTTTGLGFASCGTTSTCGASDDGNGRDSDPNDASNVVHGTHVAGTVAAVANNSLGLAGVAYNAKVVPIRVLGRDGSGGGSDIIDAITWASGGTVSGVPANANPAEVINLSLGGTRACGPAEQAAINAAVARGSVVIAAAGNFNNDVANNAPASCNNVISVGASDRGGRRAYYSSYGATLDVTAPGGEVCSPSTEHLPLGQSPRGACVQPVVVNSANAVWSTIEGNGYAGGEWQGTSMAAPHVAGVAALIQAASATPKTPAQIEQILESTARPIAAANCPGGCGAGLIDAAAAVAAVSGGTPGNQAPVANFTSSASGLTVSFTDTSSDSDGSIASRSWSFGDGTNSTSANPSKTYSAAGTYTVSLTVTDNGGASHTKTSSVTVSSSSSNVRQTYTNSGDYTIVDNGAAVESPITVSGRTGNAPSDTSLAVNIVHTYRGDLIVDLIAPDGSAYNLANRAGSSGGINKTITVSTLTSEALNGTWKLRVRDAAADDVGYINSWSITF
ncbi:S8 family serine peptidase [Lysobacter sp. cf310]|uniref:S8 family serine peptidase n=1 Tax=Lysobacter sp. cf310 TaxID=1761790 RepID=UPI0008EC4558|nr:S8 family serine peptidase [Lysobacter sp. cf310]SFL28298.1 serine protease [Lysobacter sp. cf310]